MSEHKHDKHCVHQPTGTQPPQQIPVTILTGFLGAGKTTLLNRLLKDTTHGCKFAVIENELGDVGIDDELLGSNSAKKHEHVDEELIQVVNGCICCTVRGDLMEALERLHAHLHNDSSTSSTTSTSGLAFDGVIIETTGLADPAPVVQTFFIEPSIRSKFRLDAVLTVVDAAQILDRLDEVKPKGVVNEALQQILFADKILLNKVDLLKEDGQDAKSGEEDKKQEEEEEGDLTLEVRARLQKIHPTAAIIECKHGNVDPKELVNLQAFQLDRICQLVPDFLEDEFLEFNEKHDNAISSVACSVDGELSIVLLTQWIQKLLGHSENSDGEKTLYRYKGVLAVKGKDAKYIFQGVGMLFCGTFSKELHWKPDETTAMRSNRFVFIGKNLDADALREGFAACRAPETMRFMVGDAVVANVGPEGWLSGKVIKLWDEGQAYRILLDKSGEEIWAGLDIDELVVAAPMQKKEVGKKN